jgi:methyl-accepting chemotaxis protein
MYMRFSLAKKLILTTVLLSLAAVAPFAILAYTSVSTARQSFISDRFDQLVSIREIKINQIIRYFNDRKAEASVLAANQTVIEALREFSKAFAQEGGVGGAQWKAAEDRFGAWFAKCNQLFGYYDIFLISPSGDIVYTVAKESDLGQNLASSQLSVSALGKCFQGAKQAYTLTDFAPYAPSNNEPAAFLGFPVKQGGRQLGILAMQVSIDAINSIMQERTGLGKTGETYLVGPDFLMRSDSFLEPTHHTVKASFADPLKGRVQTAASKNALKGTSGQEVVVDYNGNQVLSAYAPLQLAGLNWALLAEIDLAEVVSDSQAAQALLDDVWLISVLAGLFILAVIIYNAIVLRNTTRTLYQVTEKFEQGGQSLIAASAQVAASSESLADGASQQAASLEETSSSLEETASMARNNSQNTAQADEHMREVEEVVAQADGAMKELRKSIAEIAGASEETGKIIKTVDEIAFQTNLLALNAAVEAARAGEAGAGFAVVAEEVRNLAMRAAEAAKSTENLIQGNLRSIEQGSQLVATTDESFGRVRETASKVAAIIAEINQASRHQSQGVDQINQAMTQMDKLTQQVAANAEESAAAARELDGLAGELSGTVDNLSSLVNGGDRDEPSPADARLTEPRAARPKLLT